MTYIIDAPQEKPRYEIAMHDKWTVFFCMVLVVITLFSVVVAIERSIKIERLNMYYQDKYNTTVGDYKFGETLEGFADNDYLCVWVGKNFRMKSIQDTLNVCAHEWAHIYYDMVDDYTYEDKLRVIEELNDSISR